MKGDLLLIIDMQNVYTRGAKWECLNTEGAAENILRLEQGGAFDDVIITKFIWNPDAKGVWADYNRENSAVNHDDWSNDLVPQIEGLSKKYPVVQKSVYSSLASPQVLEACKKARRVVVTGVVAECCVLSTVFALIDQGIYTVYVKDAVSGLDRPKEEATELTLSGLCPLHVQLTTTDEFLRGQK